MAHSEVKKFISEQLAAGHSETDIRAALKAKNWPDSEIDMGFSEWRTNPTLPERQAIGHFFGETWEVLRALLPRLAILYGRFFIQSIFLVVAAGVPVAILRTLQNGGQMEKDLVNLLTAIVLTLAVVYLIYLMIWLQACLILLVKNRTTQMEPKEIMVNPNHTYGVSWAPLCWQES
jgi:hypothetical protein